MSEYRFVTVRKCTTLSENLDLESVNQYSDTSHIFGYNLLNNKRILTRLGMYIDN